MAKKGGKKAKRAAKLLSWITRDYSSESRKFDKKLKKQLEEPGSRPFVVDIDIRSVSGDARKPDEPEKPGSRSTGNPDLAQEDLARASGFLSELMSGQEFFVEEEVGVFRICVFADSETSAERRISTLKHHIIWRLEEAAKSGAEFDASHQKRQLDEEYVKDREIMANVPKALLAQALNETSADDHFQRLQSLSAHLVTDLGRSPTGTGKAQPGDDAANGQAPGSDQNPDGRASPIGLLENEERPVVPIASDDDEDTRVLAAPTWDPNAFQLRFNGCWNLQTRHLTAFRPELEVKDKGVWCPFRALPQNDGVSGAFTLTVHRYQFAKAMEALFRAFEAGKNFLIWIPVSADCMRRDEHFVWFISELENFPEMMRKYIVFEIIGLQNEQKVGVIEGMAARLKFRSRRITALTGGETANFEALAKASVKAVGMSCNDIPEGWNIQERLDGFVQKAEKAGLESYLLDINSLQHSISAVAAGFDYLEGTSISEPVEDPSGIVKFTASDLIAG